VDSAAVILELPSEFAPMAPFKRNVGRTRENFQDFERVTISEGSTEDPSRTSKVLLTLVISLDDPLQERTSWTFFGHTGCTEWATSIGRELKLGGIHSLPLSWILYVMRLNLPVFGHSLNFMFQ